jgi:glutamate---cysteine ligase / carboxylate-amine ligase
VIESAFGASPPWSVGVEEEVMIVDADSLQQTPAVDVLVRGAEGLQLPGRLKTELFASVVELNSGVCTDAAEAAEALEQLRSAAAAIAARNGLAVIAAGTHPTSVPEEQAIAPDERYARFVDYAGATARRQGVNGLHVHVGMPSADTCFDVLERILPWLPAVLALAANSPYLAGRETGLLSTRAEVLGTLPRAGAPPPFGSYAGWERFVERMAAIGVPLATDYTSFWWDVRPHPRFGTLEIRVPDQPTDVERSAALVALLQALCAAVARRPEPAPAAERGAYAQNRWAAARFGPHAELVHPDGDRLATAEEIVRELLAFVAPVARELGSSDLLGALDPAACEAEAQLELGRRAGLGAVTEELARRTLRSALGGRSL